MSVNPPGIGLVVLLATVIGCFIAEPGSQYTAAYVTIGLIHGIFAWAAAWVGFSAYRLLSPRDR